MRPFYILFKYFLELLATWRCIPELHMFKEIAVLYQMSILAKHCSQQLRSSHLNMPVNTILMLEVCQPCPSNLLVNMFLCCVLFEGHELMGDSFGRSWLLTYIFSCTGVHSSCNIYSPAQYFYSYFQPACIFKNKCHFECCSLIEFSLFCHWKL